MNEITQIKINNPQNKINNISSLNFKGDNISKQEKNKNNTAKYMIGATLLAATIALGIIGHKNNWWKKATAQTDMTLRTFKEAGNRFEKGKAVLSDGSLFSGKLTVETSFSKCVIEYEDGFIKKSTKYRKKLDNVLEMESVKEYSNGKILKNTSSYCYVRKYINDENTGKITKILRVKDNGKEELDKGFYYSNDGKLKFIYNSPDIERLRTFTEYYEGTNKIKNKFIFEEPTRVQMFDENGNMVTEVYDSLIFGLQDNCYKLGFNRTRQYSAIGTRLRFSDKDCFIELESSDDQYKIYTDIDKFIIRDLKKPKSEELYWIDITTQKKTSEAENYFNRCPHERKPRRISIQNSELVKMSFNVNNPITEITLKTGENVIYNRKTSEIIMPDNCSVTKEEIQNIIDDFNRIGNMVKKKVREHKLYYMDEFYRVKHLAHEAYTERLPHTSV